MMVLGKRYESWTSFLPQSYSFDATALDTQSEFFFLMARCKAGVSTRFQPGFNPGVTSQTTILVKTSGHNQEWAAVLREVDFP